MPFITELAEFNKPLLKAQKTGHRLILVMAMAEESSLAIACQLTHLSTSCLWVDVLKQSQSTSQTSEHQYISAAQTNQYLGTSNQYVIYSAHGGFNASALCALSGTIVGGGVLILLVPSLAQWPNNFDAQLQAYGQQVTGAHSYFISWWKKQWQQQGPQQCQKPAVYILQDPTPAMQQINTDTWQQLPSQQSLPLLQPTKDQQAIITALINAYQQQSRLVFNLSAHRGRGKSACLGWLINAIDKKPQHPPVLITAPSKRALGTLVQTAQPSLVNFYALDALLMQLPKASMLIIDEAAAVPLSQLTKLIKHYPLVVLSSTQDGYEGSGQGYRLKLPGIIATLGLSSQALTLTEPMRWQADDPLEQFIRSSFLCDVSITDATQALPTDLNLPVSYEIITGAMLAQNTSLLKQAYALLMLAHYQTTPQDLRLLLDHPQHKIHLCYQGDCLVALAWVSEEGGLSADLAQQIALGKRRIQGHLLAQILAQQAGFPRACEMRSWRIQRLVVTPFLQGKGFGSGLLSHLYKLAHEQKVDFVGASFAASTDTLEFWLANEYLVGWLGLRADAATGLNSVQVIRPISTQAHRLSDQLSHHLRGYLSFGKGLWFQSVAQKTLHAIDYSCSKNTSPGLDQVQRRRLLILLAMGQAGFSGPLHILYQQLTDTKDQQALMQAAQNNTHKGLQQGVRRLALSLVESFFDQ